MKTAVVAGAGSGIGRGCAIRFGELGYHVIAVGRDPEKLSRSIREIESRGGSAEAFAADVRDWARMQELGERTEDRGVDVLINSAGGQFVKPSAEISGNGWNAVIGTNLTGSFNLCRQLYPALVKRQASVVLIIAAIWRKPMPGVVHSAAARAGVVQMMRTLAVEWAKDGIRLNALSPGLTDTPSLRAYDALPDNVPLGRVGTVEEVIEAAMFLGRSSYITGEVLHVDGGLHL